ncbi:MAG: substrate-binding domain-containing protein, partial [Bacteroidota bacterium]
SYNRIFLVFPTDTAYPYPQEIVRGFKRACGSNNLPFEVLNEIVDSTQVKKGDLYIIISDMDLANLIKQARTKKLIIGEQLGILSYNDTPLKEVLAKGISVISTDFEHMAVKTSEMITENRLTKIRNPFQFIKRQSF